MAASVVCPTCRTDQSRSGGPAVTACFVCGAALPGALEVRAGLMFGSCRLERMLGEGGMGQAWLARHVRLESDVVVKLMLPGAEANAGSLARFVQEARLAAQLRHPNVVQVFDVDEAHGAHYIVMEFCPGGSTRDDLERRGPFSEDRAIAVMRGVASALDYAASHRIVHRDIKPENILVSATGDAKLADLGLARQATPESPALTRPSTCLGTPYYMAPEQAQDSHLADARSDLYSLGASLYHLVCGLPPFTGASAFEVVVKHATAPVPEPRHHAPRLSAGFAAVLNRCLQKAPDARFQSARELLAALDAPAPVRAGTASRAVPDIDPELREAMDLMTQLKRRKGKL